MPTSTAPALADRIAALGDVLGVDVLALLGERSGVVGLRPGTRASIGGATRLLPTADDWVALCLARPDDVELLPAWLGIPAVDDWDAVGAALASVSAVEVVRNGRDLGLPVARLGEVGPSPDAVVPTWMGDAPPLRRAPLVVNLAALWAGPLCARLLGDRGARVIQIESVHRPDRPRVAEVIRVDFTSTAGVAELRGWLRGADVVIEGSRPRALAQLGIDPTSSGARVWLSITGYGRAAPMHVAFGDDAAVAGGLVARDDDGSPLFLGDAIADPLTGVVAATAVSEALAQGGRWLLDVALARVAASVAG